MQFWLVNLHSALTTSVCDGYWDALHLDPVDANGLHSLSGWRQLRRI